MRIAVSRASFVEVSLQRSVVLESCASFNILQETLVARDALDFQNVLEFNIATHQTVSFVPECSRVKLTIT